MRLVLKFGSGILATPAGDALDAAQFQRLAAEVAALVRAGHECLVVTSGAVAAGLAPLGFRERPDDLAARQACAAVGQGLLMQRYATEFAAHGLVVAQLLLTYGDLDSRSRHANARTTLERLLERRVALPIINENDPVAVEELKFGDNDRLSAEVAILAEADRLLLLTSVDGLLDAAGRTVPRVDDLDAVAALVRPEERGRLSVGGMGSKLHAVRLALAAGIPTHILHGRHPGQLAAALAGEGVGTFFPAPAAPL